ncbi:MAG: hypothetical protein M3275_06000 [Thermoproteota archaeon]|nr:hypothetical protein [Thermoproteota archaeon]
MFESFILQESLPGSPKSRPPGVTIIAILNIIGGIIMLFASTICFQLWELGWLWHIPFRNCALAHRRRKTIIIGSVIIAIGLYRSLLPMVC